jgi:hypothetical protein
MYITLEVALGKAPTTQPHGATKKCTTPFCRRSAVLSLFFLVLFFSYFCYRHHVVVALSRCRVVASQLLAKVRFTKYREKLSKQNVWLD